MRERTLPSGVFLHVRRATYLDVLGAKRSTIGCEDLYPAFLLAAVATFDGEKLLPQQIIDMDYADVHTALGTLQEMMNGPIDDADAAERLAAEVVTKIQNQGEPQP